MEIVEHGQGVYNRRVSFGGWFSKVPKIPETRPVLETGRFWLKYHPIFTGRAVFKTVVEYLCQICTKIYRKSA